MEVCYHLRHEKLAHVQLRLLLDCFDLADPLAEATGAFLARSRPFHLLRKVDKVFSQARQIWNRFCKRDTAELLVVVRNDSREHGQKLVSLQIACLLGRWATLLAL